MNTDQSNSDFNPDSEAIETPPRTVKEVALQFLLGGVAASLLVLVPLSYFQFFTVGMTLNPVHLAGSVGVVLLGGVLAAIWGSQAIAILMKMVESLPWQ